MRGNRFVGQFRQACILIALLSFGWGFETASAEGQEWGEISDGLQLRIVSVLSETDEQSPDFDSSKRTSEFKIANQVTFLAQLKNASEKPISLQGVRFGDGVSKPWPGKSQQSKFGPNVFNVQIFESTDRLVEGPESDTDNDFRMLGASSGSVEVLAPGETVTMLIKPISWDSSLATTLSGGEYSVEVAFVGTRKEVQAKIKEHWPDKPLGKVWSGEVKSPRTKITIKNSYRDLRPKLAWGKPKDGIRVAAEYRLADTRAENPQDFIDRIFPLGAQINVRYYVQNASKEVVEFKSATWRQDDQLLIVHDNGEKRVQHPWYTGISPQKTWQLKPKQIVTVDVIPIAFPTIKKDPTFNPMGAVIKSGVGEYRLRHELSGGISTGITLLTLRDRKPTDEPASFPARLNFSTPDRKLAINGFVRVKTVAKGKLLFEGAVDSGVLELEKWTGVPLSVYARFPGFEENTFHDVNPVKNGVKLISMTPANPITMKLVDENDQPVAGAKIRFFVRTGAESKNYPFPMTGVEGPIHATSGEDGSVSLDMVQEGHIYTFYVEPEKLAPTFVSGIKPGTKLGTIKHRSPFEVSGIINGSPEQLKHFAAEWDQPIALKLADGTLGFEYAVSNKLTATRDGKQLRFKLSNLRLGKLRIIACFAKRPHSVGHEFAKRTIGESDQLFEFELTGPQDDLVIVANEE